MTSSRSLRAFALLGLCLVLAALGLAHQRLATILGGANTFGFAL